MSVVGLCRLARDVGRNTALVAELKAAPEAVLARYPLSGDERDAVLDLDAARLVELGLNPLPMRNLVTLLGVGNPELYTHTKSLRGTTMSLWTDTLGAEVRFHQAGLWRTRALEAGSGDRHVILLSGITGHVEGWSRNVVPLAELLAAGELDAVYTPRAPRTFADGTGRVRRLFEPSGPAEVEYFQRTGIFPTMHVVVLRREVYERNRWLARSLFDAFAEAKRLCEENFAETAALRYMLPWLLDEVDRTKAILGDDFWPYGLEPNRHTLETFLRYSYDQGLAARRLEPEDLFAPETLETTLV